MKRCFLLLLMVLTVFFAVPDITANAVGENGENYSAFLYDHTNGLPTPEANDIIQTNDGFIWIGSDSGLIRYDGNTFEYMGYEDGITSVKCLYADSRGRLWIGMENNGIAVVENNQFRFFAEQRYSTAYSIAEDGNNNIYISFREGITVIDSKNIISFLNNERLDNTYVKSLKKGNDGMVYALCSNSDIFTLKDSNIITFIDHKTFVFGDISCILPDIGTSGKLWFSSGKVIYHADVTKHFSDWDISGITDLPIHDMEYIDGKIMLCTANCAGILEKEYSFEAEDPDDVDCEIRYLEHLPMNDSIRNVMQDHEGNLWFTSTTQGVMKVVPNLFTDIFKKYSLPVNAVSTSCLYNDTVFIGTEMGLTIMDNTGKTVSSYLLNYGDIEQFTYNLLELLKNSNVSSIVRDSRNRLWISVWNSCGLLCCDKGNLEFYSDYSDKYVSNKSKTVYERNDGSIVAVMSDGINIISKDGKVIKSFYTDVPESLSAEIDSKLVQDFYQDISGDIRADITAAADGENGDILIGTDGDGIAILSGDRISRVLTKADGLTSNTIRRIRHDHQRDIYWIVTSDSIACMTPDYQITTVTEFPYYNNFDLCQNSRDEMWILNSSGIFVVPTSDMLSNQEMSPLCYSTENGLQYIPTSDSYSFLDEDGDLYISGNKGISKVNIETALPKHSYVKSSVPYIDADGSRIYPDENGNFHVPSGVRKLTLYPHVFSYSLTSPTVYYRLDNFEDTFTSVAYHSLSPIDYTNLSGGEYEFIMHTKNEKGIVVSSLSVTIAKERSLFEYMWFNIFVVLFTVILVGIAGRLYFFAQMRKLEKEHRKSMTLIHDITEAFAKVIDMKDNYTNGHSTRVAKYTAMLAKELGCDRATIEQYYYIALLHDIGKVGVPTEVLNKPGKLTDEEFDMIKSHASLGYEALKGIKIMPELALGAQSHHERPDGKGYPNHLKGDEIPRAAQIIAVADCFDAMYSNRPYRKRMNFEKAVSIIKESAGTQLTEDVVEAFLRLVEKGKFRAPDDKGGGTTENIENIRKDDSKNNLPS